MRESESLQAICPICLDACSQGKKETCERGHTMHQGCALKMCKHMKLLCPLCRSMMICPDCQSKKEHVWCTCSFSSAGPEDNWMQKFIKSYVWFEFAVIFYSFEVHAAVALFLIIAIHFNVMAHRVVSMQREHPSFWAIQKNWGLMLTQIGLEMLMVLFIANFFVRSINIWQNKFASAARYIGGQEKMR
jgi:hypothetical protein